MNLALNTISVDLVFGRIYAAVYGISLALCLSALFLGFYGNESVAVSMQFIKDLIDWPIAIQTLASLSFCARTILVDGLLRNIESGRPFR